MSTSFESMNVANDIRIDKGHLEEECLTLPSTYYQYSFLAQEAKQQVSVAADNLKVITAERNIAIREHCANTGKKTTEGIITAMVDSDSEVMKAREQLRQAEATYGKFSVAVSAIEIKKSEIDNIVKLYLKNNFIESETKGTQQVSNDYVDVLNRQSMTKLPDRN